MIDAEESTFRAALHQYASGLLQILHVFDVRQIDVAKQLGVSPALVTAWLQGRKDLQPHHEAALRPLLQDALTRKRQALLQAETAELQLFQVQVLPVLVDLDQATLAMHLAYAKSVRAMNREFMAQIGETLQNHAMSEAVAFELRLAFNSAQEALAGVRRLWPGLKARNRRLKAIVTPSADVRADVAQLLEYIEKVYCREESPPVEGRTKPGRKPRRTTAKART